MNRRFAIILILNSTIIFISQMFCADRNSSVPSYLDLPAWVNNYPSQIINDAGSSSVIEMGKKKFSFYSLFMKEPWALQCISFQKKKVLLKGRILKTV